MLNLRISSEQCCEEPRTPIFLVPADHARACTSALHPCTELALINSSELDSRLRFQSGDHICFYDGVSGVGTRDLTASRILILVSRKE